MSSSEASDYCLQKTTRRIKCPQQFTQHVKKDTKSKQPRNNKEKVTAFATHLENIFKICPTDE